MNPHIASDAVGRQPMPQSSHYAQILQSGEVLRRFRRRAQRFFLTLNAVPLGASVVLSSFTDIPGVRLYGQLTVGLAWGSLQIALLIVTARLYEARYTRSGDPIEESVGPEFPPAEPSTASVHNRSGW